MKIFDYLIIGSGIAGVSAAQTLRKHDSNTSIGVVSNEPHDPYSKVLLPFWLKGKIDIDGLFIRGKGFWKKNNIDFVCGSVTAIDRSAQKITTIDGHSFFYHKLLIASGADAKKLEFPGSDISGVFCLRNLDDAAAIKKYYDTPKEDGRALQPIIYGASFIALEYAGIFAYYGISANMIFRGPYFWSSMLDESGGKLIEKFLESAGMSLHRKEILHSVSGEAHLGQVTTNKSSYRCNFLGVGIGLARNLEFVRAAGLKINQGIITNEYLTTNDPRIFVAGDVAEFYDVIIERSHVLGNWLNSEMQGRVAAVNMMGVQKPFELVSSYSFTFDGRNGAGKFSICMIGDVRGNEECVHNIIKKDSQYICLYSKNNVCTGAILINCSYLRTKITESIRQKAVLDKLNLVL